MAELGQIPKQDAAEIRKRARFSIPEILEIEKRTNHDVIAFLENVASSVGPAARWMHQGLTSSDVLDTTLAVQLTEASRILAKDLTDLRATVATQARRFKMTPMIGRSHGIHAEPITFGLKLALMFDEFGRAEERLEQALERIRVGKLSGAVVTHAHLDNAMGDVHPFHERYIRHSSAERIILTDSCILLDYMLVKLRELVEGLLVYPERMQQNLELSKGLYSSESVLLALTKAGAERKNAYEAVQRAAMRSWKGEGSFADNAKREPEITARLSEPEIDALCSLDVHLRHVDSTFRSVGLE